MFPRIERGTLNQSNQFLGNNLEFTRQFKELTDDDLRFLIVAQANQGQLDDEMKKFFGKFKDLVLMQKKYTEQKFRQAALKENLREEGTLLNQESDRMIRLRKEFDEIQVDINNELLKALTLSPFVRRNGPRRDLIIGILNRSNITNNVDPWGNVWAWKGHGNDAVLFSSHMDTEYGQNKENYFIYAYQTKRGMIYKGTLDNSLGCYINIILALTSNPSKKVYYVFTVDEEEKPNGSFGDGSKEVARQLNEENIHPLCVALDATFPQMNVSLKDFDEAKENLIRKRVYDITDDTNCYVENFSDPKIQRYVSRIIDNKSIRIRDLQGWDEATYYKSAGPSFAFGPVIYGEEHKRFARVYARSIELSIGFCRRLIR